MEGFRAILSVPFRHGRYGGLLAVCRPRRTADFSDEEAAALGSMVPHVARALKLRLDADVAMRRAAVTLEALDRTDAALAVVDADLRPMILSRRAADILAQGDGLVRSRQGLTAGTHGETLLLRRRVRRAAAEDPRIAGRHALRLTRAPPRPPWSLTLHRLDPESAAAGEPLVAMFMEDASPGPMDIAAALNAMFDLTPRETAVAVALAQGRDLAETAADLEVAAGTARNYLKAIFLKTGTRRQGELISLILRLNRFSR
jgi:DNA-binding CsgD family transcriptional regulator